jgi:hypothetical protein
LRVPALNSISFSPSSTVAGKTYSAGPDRAGAAGAREKTERRGYGAWAVRRISAGAGVDQREHPEIGGELGGRGLRVVAHERMEEGAEGGVRRQRRRRVPQRRGAPLEEARLRQCLDQLAGDRAGQEFGTLLRGPASSFPALATSRIAFSYLISYSLRELKIR